MPKLSFITAALAAALVYDTKVHYKNRKKYAAAKEEIEILSHNVNFNGSMVKYLCQKMDAHGIELDEFDLIALSNPMD